LSAARRRFPMAAVALLAAGGLLGVAGAAGAATTVVELESLLPAAVSGGPIDVQPMAGFGPGWGGNAQVFWRAPAPQETPIRNYPHLTMAFPVAAAGAYDLVLYYTVAPDYGDFSVFVEGQKVADIHGYEAGVALRHVPLGHFDFGAGKHQIVFTVFGKAAASSGYIVGLDRLELADGKTVMQLAPGVVKALRVPAGPGGTPGGEPGSAPPSPPTRTPPPSPPAPGTPPPPPPPPTPPAQPHEQREIVVFDPATGRAHYLDLTPAGQPASVRDLGVQWEASSQFISSRDMNGDGRWDLLRWVPERTTLEMVRFDAAGHLEMSEPVFNALWEAPQIVAGDFNGDGRDDVAMLDVDSATLRTLQFDDAGVLSTFNEISDFPFPDLGAPHDLRGDGRDVLVVQLADGTVEGVELDAALSAFSTREMGSVAATRLAFGDFDGDGGEEIVASDAETGALEMIDLGADLRFAARHPLPPRAPQVRTYDYNRDWDGDGRDELALAETAADGLAVSVLFFDPAGNLARSVPVLGQLSTGPAIAPLTASGPPSLLYKDAEGVLRLVVLDGDLAVRATLALTLGLGDDAFPIPRNFDGD
jgi:FG-GAP-like repeat